MRLGCLLALALLTLSEGVRAQDHLQPIYQDDRHQALLERVFVDARDSRSVVQAIITPSSSPERSISLHRVGHRYVVRVLEPTEHLYRYVIAEALQPGGTRIAWASGPQEEAEELARQRSEVLEGLPTEPTDVRLDRCERQLPTSTGQRLEVVWQALTTSARADTPEEIEADDGIYVDGTSYYFWSRGPAGETDGDAYFPRSGAVLSLAQIAIALENLCTGRGRERALLGHLHDLEEELSFDQ